MHSQTFAGRRLPWRLAIIPLGLALALLVSHGSAAPSAVPAASWERLPIGPDRALHTMIYDAANQLFWSFGGIFADGGESFENTVYKMDAQNPQGGWTLVPISGQRPDRRALQSAVYDPLRERMIVFGGAFDFDSLQVASGIHVWFLDLSDPNNPTWTRQAITAGPPDRFGHAAVYVPEFDAMVVTGGVDRDSDTRNDNYALLLGTNPPRWIRITGVGMFGRAGHVLVYDAVGQQLVMYGGTTTFPDLRTTNEVLSLDISDGLAEAQRWVPLSPNPTGLRRAFMATGFDPISRLLWVHGGLLTNNSFLGDLSVLDLTTTPPSWTITNVVANGPLDRFGHASAWDSGRQRMVVQGGSPDGNVTLRDSYALNVMAGPPSPSATATSVPPTATRTPTATTTSAPPTATRTPTATTTSAPPTTTRTPTATTTSAPLTATASPTAQAPTVTRTATASRTVTATTTPPGSTPTATATQPAGAVEIYLPLIRVNIGFRPTGAGAASQ